MRNFKDESFIAQYLSPKVMRDFKLFAVLDDDMQEELEITAIHDEAGYRRLRLALADQYNLGSREPNIQVWNVAHRKDRSLTLRHTPLQSSAAARDSAQEVLKHLHRLWGFTVRLGGGGRRGSSGIDRGMPAGAGAMKFWLHEIFRGSHKK
jgi:stage V sporulation protein R